VAGSFELLAGEGRARRGRWRLDRGVVETPAFMPVGTLGAVKGVPAAALEDLGATIQLANLYHLALRPGIDRIERLGGIHAFTGWRGPLLTDSGGFQVWSLAGLRRVDEDGVSFRSHLDGAELRFTPESVVRDQERIGVDVAMVLDECPPYPVEEAEAARSLELTNRWAERALAARRRPEATALFAIAQGSVFPALRERAAERLGELPFDGFAIGGVSVGEPEAEIRRIVETTAPRLPDRKPRYLMGVGTPGDILHAVLQGVDLFDCVLPARNARHGLLFTGTGTIRIKNARFRDDEGPIDPDCECPTCRRHSRAFVHHLVRCGEITGKVLATLHNLRFFLDFMGEVRKAIESRRLGEWARSRAFAPTEGNRSEIDAPPD